MSALWVGVLLTAAGCYALKLTGLSVPERVLDHPVTQRATDLIPVALLGALIGVQVLGGERALVVDARLAGLGVAALLLWFRVPFLPMVVAAAATAALLRL
ncbi:AzlD domain-containing protein [Aeromicrobium sp. CF4.19]|uniref:AzlD domain-containing protein n=1 Tax=Aeromicrobium sp. CF4.19 TaxID=3373082 RepID=UPI003EE53CD8